MGIFDLFKKKSHKTESLSTTSDEKSNSVLNINKEKIDDKGNIYHPEELVNVEGDLVISENLGDVKCNGIINVANKIEIGIGSVLVTEASVAAKEIISKSSIFSKGDITSSNNIYVDGFLNSEEGNIHVGGNIQVKKEGWVSAEKGKVTVEGDIFCKKLKAEEINCTGSIGVGGICTAKNVFISGKLVCISLLECDNLKGEVLETSKLGFPGSPDNHQLIHTVLSKDKDCLKLLLKTGIDISEKTVNNETPIMFAATQEDSEILKILLKVTNDVDEVDDKGNSAVHMASLEGYLNNIEALYKSNADIDLARNDGVTPLHLACNNGWLDVVQFLLEKGAEPRKVAGDDNAISLARRAGYKGVVKLLTTHAETR